MLPGQTILHPTDFSEHSAYAFQLACSLARDYRARLVVLHVMEPRPPLYGEMALVPALPEETEEALREKLQEVQASTAKVPVETLLKEGSPAKVILETAAEVKADLVVIGTHGRGVLGRLLMGSIAAKVVRKSSCPVLVVKKPSAFAVPEEERLVSAHSSLLADEVDV